jgi:hypothetical protein
MSECTGEGEPFDLQALAHRFVVKKYEDLAQADGDID